MNIPVSHLAQEAIAALVDGELSGVAAGRAARHLTGCLQCRLAVEAQREAKEALHTTHDVAVPGDLLSRLQAIPFTADVSASGGFGGLGGSGTVLSLEHLTPQETPDRPGQARWLRRGMAAGLAGIGVGVVALAVSLPTGGAQPGPVARPDTGSTVTSGERTAVVPPVVRTLTVGTDLTGGTP